MTHRRRAYEAGWGTIASGLLHEGMEVGQLTPKARDEIREALETVLRLSEERDLRLAAALRELDKGAAEIDRLKALMTHRKTTASVTLTVIDGKVTTVNVNNPGPALWWVDGIGWSPYSPTDKVTIADSDAAGETEKKAKE